jgi:hypothetical protein
MWRATIAAAAALITLSACSSSGGNEAEASPAAVGQAAGDEATPPEPIPMPTWCTPATPEDVQAIEQALTVAGNTLTDAFTTELNGYRYVMANVDAADGSRLTSADIWVFDTTGQLYAASSSAVEHSALPDAANLTDADPFGPDVSAMTDCLTASAQQRNLGS